MIYDCFTFFNELDLLEIRLNTLKDVVDRFVLVEARQTHTGKPKPLFYAANKDRFAAFSGRIAHIVIDEFPAVCRTAWGRENYQRNAISQGLTDADDEDTVLISDLDEIPNPDLVKNFADHCKNVVYSFDQTYYSYFLNYRNVRQQWWHGTKMLSYENFLHVFDSVHVIVNELLPLEVNTGTTASKIRMRKVPRKRAKTVVLHNGGWHFTNIGGAENLAFKMRSFAHQEYNPGDEEINIAELQRMIFSGLGPFWEVHCFAEPIDESFPKYIRDNLNLYSKLIFPVTRQYLVHNRFPRLLQSVRGHFIGMCERMTPSALHNFLHLCKRRIMKSRRRTDIQRDGKEI